MKQGLLSVLLIFGIGLSLSAQISENTSLTNLYENAASYPGLKAKTASIEAAKLNQTITKRKILPGIQLQAQNTYGSYESTAGAFFPVGGIFNVSGDGSSGDTAVNTFISATAQWDFIQFGKHRDKVKLAQIDKNKAETDYELADVKLKKKLTDIYLSWQYANYMQDWAEREVERDSIILKLSQSRVNSGLASAADSLIAKTKLKQTLAQKIKWEAQTRTAENRIKEYAGLSVGKEKPAKQFLSTLEDRIVESQQKTHPLLEAKKQEGKRLEVQEKNITHEVLPNISLLAGGMFRGVGFSDEGSQWEDSYELPINNYLVGLGLTWDISSFYSHGVKKRLNQQEQTRVKEEHTAVERHLEERENSLLYHINKSLDEIKEVEEAYVAASESYRLFKVRYESGIIDLTTLLQIQQTLQFTEKSRLKAYYDYWSYWNAYAYSQADFSVLTTVFN